MARCDWWLRRLIVFLVLQILLDGAAVRGVRMLVQSGWSEISDDSFQKMTASAAKKARSMTGTATSSAAGIGTHSETGRKHNNTSTESDVDHSDVRNVEEEGGGFEAMLIGALPHDWLFPFLKAVIHHGGAGKIMTQGFWCDIMSEQFFYVSHQSVINHTSFFMQCRHYRCRSMRGKTDHDLPLLWRPAFLGPHGLSSGCGAEAMLSARGNCVHIISMPLWFS